MAFYPKRKESSEPTKSFFSGAWVFSFRECSHTILGPFVLGPKIHKTKHLSQSLGCEASHGADQPAFWTPQRGNRASGGDVGNCDSEISPEILARLDTPPKFNIDPEKWWLEDYFPFGMAYFRGYVKLREGTIKNDAIFEAADACSKAHLFLWCLFVKFRGCMFCSWNWNSDDISWWVWDVGEWDVFPICLTPPLPPPRKIKMPLQRDQDSKGKDRLPTIIDRGAFAVSFGGSISDLMIASK